MSQRGNHHHNAVVESFFQAMMRESVKRKIYPRRDAARADLFDYIELLYNAEQRHSARENLVPVECNRQHRQRLGRGL